MHGMEAQSRSAGVPPTRRRVLRGCLITLGVITVGFAAFIAWVLIELEGGPRWAFSTASKATDQQVVAARLEGDKERDRLVSILQSAGMKAGLTPVAMTDPAQDCTEGQHNWKRNDNYDLQCQTSVRLILGSIRRSETALRTQLLALDDHLAANGWQSRNTEPIWSSIRMRIDELRLKEEAAGRLTPFLDRGSASYFLGEPVRSQGSKTISLDFTADRRSHFNRAPNSPLTTVKSIAVLEDTRAFLSSSPDRYVVVIDLAYVYFSG